MTVPDPPGESVAAELTDPLDEEDTPGLAVPAEGELWGLELGETVPLRLPVLVEDPLPETETVCVPDLDTTELLDAVAAPEVLFDTEADAV